LPLTAIICSRSPRLLRRCLKSLRETAPDIIRRVIVVMHEERGPDAVLRQVVRDAGAEAVPFTGVFNFSEMNNLAARVVGTPGILFLNDDVIATASGWAEMLAAQIARERIGIAGSVLRYPSGDIQHAGIVTGIGDGVGHVGRYAGSSPLWPWLEKQRNVSAVTGACLAIRTELFESIGGFDPEFPNNYNDVDVCLRVRERGYEIVCVPAPGLIHAECQTRHGIVQFEERYRFYARWAHILSRPDPYYSESLAPTETIALNLTGTRGFRTLLR
jgi:GT2 family glycosyltransferase